MLHFISNFSSPQDEDGFSNVFPLWRLNDGNAFVPKRKWNQLGWWYSTIHNFYCFLCIKNKKKCLVSNVVEDDGFDAHHVAYWPHTERLALIHELSRQPLMGPLNSLYPSVYKRFFLNRNINTLYEIVAKMPWNAFKIGIVHKDVWIIEIGQVACKPLFAQV